MKRHYTTVDLAVLRTLSKPGWVVIIDMWPDQFGSTDISWMSLTNSLGRLVTDNLIEQRYVNNAIQARRLDWPAELSRIVAA